MRAADTFFIATSYPDYVVNNYFNTLGNLALNSRAGLLVIDFATGDLLFVAVRVEIVWGGPEVERLACPRVDFKTIFTKPHADIESPVNFVLVRVHSGANARLPGTPTNLWPRCPRMISATLE